MGARCFKSTVIMSSEDVSHTSLGMGGWETLNIHQSQFEREPVKLDPHRTAGTLPC